MAILVWQGYFLLCKQMSYQTGAATQKSISHNVLEKLSTKRSAELEYLSDMLPQLRQMALGLGEQTLARLLEIAMMEAQLQYDITNMQLDKEKD